MKRGIPDQPEGSELTSEQWSSLTDEERDAVIRALGQEAAVGATGAAAPPQVDQQVAAPRPKRRRIVSPSASSSEEEGEGAVEPAVGVDAQAAAQAARQKLQDELFGDSDWGFEEDAPPKAAVKKDLGPVTAGDAYIVGHGETVADVQPAALEPAQVLCFYANKGKDLHFIDGLRVLSLRNTAVKYRVTQGDGQQPPLLSLTPLEPKEAQWARLSMSGDGALDKQKVFFIGEPPLDGEKLSLHDALLRVRYQCVHIIACQGAQDSAADVEKSEEARAVETLALQIIDSAAGVAPKSTLAYIEGQQPADRAELLSIPIFEFFVYQLENPIVGAISQKTATAIKADVEHFMSESGAHGAVVGRLLWCALPEPTRNALSDQEKHYWEKIAAGAVD